MNHMFTSKRIEVLFLFCLFCKICAFGQQAPKVIPPSPNAASLGKYGDIPINLHTGLPSISIPIYEIKEGLIKLPITLNYHASGIRVSETASWVGLGWSLNTGGLISRTVQHLPDEGKTAGTLPYSTGYYKDGYSLPEDIPLCTNPPCPSIPNEYYQFRNAAAGQVDAEPDIFFYNFNGYSGKFMFDEQKKAVFMPQEDIDVTVSGNLDSFIFTMPDGSKYYFGQNQMKEYSNSSTNSFPNNVYDRVLTSWFLTKIESPLGDIVAFEYEDEEYAFFDLAPERFINGLSEGTVNQALCGPSRKSITITIVTGKRLAKILSTLVEIEFSAQTQREDLSANTASFSDVLASQGNYPKAAKRLDKILIKKPFDNTFDNSCSKEFNFTYTYFTAHSISVASQIQQSITDFGLITDAKRLKLNSITERSCDGSVSKNPHSFLYYETDNIGQPVKLPRRVSLAQDTWGYYNGANSNATLVDIANDGVCEGFHNRLPDYNNTVIAALKTIIYPTTGTTTFKYELHGNSTRKVGGLRIAEIIDTDPFINKTKVKKYFYERDELFNTPVYLHNIYLQLLSNNNHVPVIFFYGGSIAPLFAMYSSSSIIPMQTTQGSHIGYGTVTVKEEGNGSSSYVYDLSVAYPYSNTYELIPNTNFFGDPIIGFPTVGSQLYNYPIRPAKFKFERGNLLAEIHYNQQGDKLSETLNTYETYSYTVASNVKMRATKLEIFNHPNSGEYLMFVHYPVFYGKSRITKKENRIYDMNGSSYLTTITNYTYGSTTHLQVTETKQNTSQGKQMVTKYIYPPDYGNDIPTSATGALKGIKNLQDRHIWIPVIEQFTYLQNTDGSSQQVTSGSITIYKEDQPLPSEVRTMEITEPIPLVNPSNPSIIFKPSNYILNALNIDNSYQPKSLFQVYNQKGKPEQIATPNNISKVYIWGYNNSLPIAEITNADLSRSSQISTIASQELSNLTSSSSSLTSVGTPFTVSVNQALMLNLNAQIQRGTSSGVTFTLRVKNISGQLVFEKTANGPVAVSPSSTVISVTTPVLTTGDYFFECIASGFVQSDINTILRLIISSTDYQYIKYHQKVFHTSFEEETNSNTTAKTGVKSHLGTFAIPMPAQAGTYVLTYWEREPTGNTWTYKEEVLNLAANAEDKVIGSSTKYIDEVRLYPQGAMMTTFTYDSLKGITSQTDPSGVTTTYKYDALGRLELIKDQDGNIVKHFVYHYKTSE